MSPGGQFLDRAIQISEHDFSLGGLSMDYAIQISERDLSWWSISGTAQSRSVGGILFLVVSPWIAQS